MKIGVLESEKYSPKALKRLSALGEVLPHRGGDIADFARDKQALFIRLKHYIGPEILVAAAGLKYICTPTTGLTHIDGRYAAQKGISIVSLKGETEFLEQIRATPEHTFGLCLALMRRYKYAFLGRENTEWDRDRYKGEEIFGKTAGIIGMGRVGGILAGYLHAFGARVLFFDTQTETKPGPASRVASVGELIAASDIVFLCASYSADGRVLLGPELIDGLKGKYFINTARGELADERHLLARIKEDFFKGVAVDVIGNEHAADNNLKNWLLLAERHNLVITPHIAGLTHESTRKTDDFIVEKFERLLNSGSRPGGTPGKP